MRIRPDPSSFTLDPPDEMLAEASAMDELLELARRPLSLVEQI